MEQATVDRAIDIPDAASATTPEAWADRMDEIGEELGYFQPLGPAHAAFFVDDGPTLLVSFETAESIRANTPGRMPTGYALARAEGWSFLCIIADGPTWWRDPAVWAFFDRQVDDAFFEDFDRVVFFGAEAGGYAAAAFSVAAPGATVLAIRPHATLAPERAEWDNRHTRHRRLDFTTRYGYAPDMVEGARHVFLLYDPERAQDAMHAALFDRPHVTRLRCRHMGGRLEAELERMGLLDALLRMVLRDGLDAGGFFRLYRARRGHLPYILRLMSRLTNHDRHGLAKRLARWALARQDHPRLRELQATVERLHKPGG